MPATACPSSSTVGLKIWSRAIDGRQKLRLPMAPCNWSPARLKRPSPPRTLTRGPVAWTTLSLMSSTRSRAFLQDEDGGHPAFHPGSHLQYHDNGVLARRCRQATVLRSRLQVREVQREISPAGYWSAQSR